MSEATGIPIPQLDQRDSTAAELPPLRTETVAAADAPPVKRRRRRGPNKPKQQEPLSAPVQTPEQQQQEIADLSKALGLGFQMGGKIAAAMRGDHWLVSDQEAEALGDAWAVALAPYMGKLAPYMPMVFAGVTTIGVFAPKVQTDRRMRNGQPLPLAAPDIPREATVAVVPGNVSEEAPNARNYANDPTGGFPAEPIAADSALGRRSARKRTTELPVGG